MLFNGKQRIDVLSGIIFFLNFSLLVKMFLSNTLSQNIFGSMYIDFNLIVHTVNSKCKFHIIIISRKDVIQWQTQNRFALRNYIQSVGKNVLMYHIEPKYFCYILCSNIFSILSPERTLAIRHQDGAYGLTLYFSNLIWHTRVEDL